MEPSAPHAGWRLWAVPRFALVTAAVLVVILGTGGYAYASPSVTRGDALYGVKRGIERVQGAWQRTPIQRVEYHSNLALRRAAELEVLVREAGAPARVGVIPIAWAASSPEPESSDPIQETAAEVVDESHRAADAAEEIEDPVVAERALTVLRRRQPIVAARLARTIPSVRARGDERRIRAVEGAARAVESVTRATDAAAVDVTRQRARGERRVQLQLRERPAPSEAIDAPSSIPSSVPTKVEEPEPPRPQPIPPVRATPERRERPTEAVIPPRPPKFLDENLGGPSVRLPEPPDRVERPTTVPVLPPVVDHDRRPRSPQRDSGSDDAWLP